MFTTFKCPAVISRCYRIMGVMIYSDISHFSVGYSDISHFSVGWLRAPIVTTLEIDSRYLLPEMETLAEAA